MSGTPSFTARTPLTAHTGWYADHNGESVQHNHHQESGAALRRVLQRRVKYRIKQLRKGIRQTVERQWYYCRFGLSARPVSQTFQLRTTFIRDQRPVFKNSRGNATIFSPSNQPHKLLVDSQQAFPVSVYTSRIVQQRTVSAIFGCASP